EAHTVLVLPSDPTQLLIGLHRIPEVTTPQAFQMLKELKLKVRMPERTFGTFDHIIPTADQTRPYADPEAEEMAQHMYRNMKEFGLPLFDMASGKQGIVHVIGPELGLSQPGMTIACGDSHTSTHGAVGAIAFGIGTPQVRDVLATQCLAMARPDAPKYGACDRAATWWKSGATEPGAKFDDVARLDGAAIEPVVTWGINPGMSVGVSQKIPSPESAPETERPTFREALAHMGF